MTKTASTQVPVLDLIADRWSPRAFQQRPVEREKLLALLEAARWAASSRNLQPWNFIVATSDQPIEHARLAHCLTGNNQRWAPQAPVLILVVAQLETDGGHNRQAWHDVGLAVGNLTIQAMYSGLMVHQMGGFDREKARALYGIPRTHEPGSVLAVGYRALPETLPEDLRDRELAPRTRKPLSEFVFSGAWGQAASLAGEPAGVS